jgi:hypothetical protein
VLSAIIGGAAGPWVAGTLHDFHSGSRDCPRPKPGISQATTRYSRFSSEGTKRPCRLAPDGIAAIDQWLGMLRDALAKNYDRLDEVLATMKPVERKDMP